jgi:hypothetical protein
VDSQPAKTTGVGGEERGYDGGKKVRGRERHLLVDTEGFVLKAERRNRGKNTTLLASMTIEGMGPSLALEGATTSAVFETDVERVLAPMLRKGQVVVMETSQPTKESGSGNSSDQGPDAQSRGVQQRGPARGDEQGPRCVWLSRALLQ